jgi:hypothetical protein
MKMMRLLRAVLLRLVLLFLALLYAGYVWPTRYRYDHLSSEGNTYPVRIDRLNGDADMLVPDEGWTPVEGETGSGNEAAPTRTGVGTGRARDQRSTTARAVLDSRPWATRTR